MTSTFWKRNMHAVAALMAATAACGQWSFTLDTTFRTQIVQQNVNSMAVLPSGELLLSGLIRFPGDMYDRPLAKVTSSGQQVVTFPYGYGSGKLTPWNDQFYVQNGNLVRRLLPSGLLDNGFLSMSAIPFVQHIATGDYHVFPDGRVLLSGMHTLSDSIRGFVGQYHLVWLSNTGYLDTTRVHRQANGVIRAFTELPDGKFLCSCTCTQYEGQPVSRLFRIHADGSLDTTFQSTITMGRIYAMEPQPDGKVLLGGNFRFNGAPQDTVRLARLHADGSRDTTFASLAFAGNGNWWSSSGTIVFDIFPFHGGNWLIAGQFTSVAGQPRKGLCMVDANGALQGAFDGCGVGPFTYQGTTNATPLSIAWNPDSTALYICGTYAGYTDGTTNDPDQRFVSRLLVSELSVGVQEQTPPQATLLLWPNPSNQQTWLAYSLPGHSGPVQLRIRDAQGRLAHSIQASGEEGQVVWDTRDVAPGIYTVELLRDGHVERTERLVIQP